MAYLAGGFIVDAVGPRSTYLLAGIATFVVGFVVLLLMIAGPVSEVEEDG